jgi:hypothetical protein
MIDETNETQEFEYQQPAQPSEADVQIKQIEQSRVTMTKEDINAVNERKAFETYIKNQGIEIPKNFKDAGAYFDSLKSAQKEYTKARQEIADLKKRYEANTFEESVNTEEVIEQVTPEVETKKELRIQKPKEQTQTEQTKQPVVTDEDWSKWSMEVAISGDISEETRMEIRETTGFSDRVINDYVEGQKAKSREAFSKAADLVGGNNKLSSIFEWASKNLSPQQQADINATLASPSWDVALLGLEAKYNKAVGNSAKQKEVQGSKKQVNVSSTAQVLKPYKTKREFYAERSSPRYHSEPKFRKAVEQRIAMSDIARLPN